MIQSCLLGLIGTLFILSNNVTIYLKKLYIIYLLLIVFFTSGGKIGAFRRLKININ